MYFVGTSARMYAFQMDGVKRPIDKLFNSRDFNDYYRLEVLETGENMR